MALKNQSTIEIPNGLLDAIRSFPVEREVEHCGVRIVISPFDIYADCPQCGSRIKVRSFSSHEEIEDIFDAVFEWLLDPKAQELSKHRQQVIEEDLDD